MLSAFPRGPKVCNIRKCEPVICIDDSDSEPERGACKLSKRKNTEVIVISSSSEDEGAPATAEKLNTSCGKESQDMQLARKIASTFLGRSVENPSSAAPASDSKDKFIFNLFSSKVKQLANGRASEAGNVNSVSNLAMQHTENVHAAGTVSQSASTLQKQVAQDKLAAAVAATAHNSQGSCRCEATTGQQPPPSSTLTGGKTAHAATAAAASGPCPEPAKLLPGPLGHTCVTEKQPPAASLMRDQGAVAISKRKKKKPAGSSKPKGQTPSDVLNTKQACGDMLPSTSAAAVEVLAVDEQVPSWRLRMAQRGARSELGQLWAMSAGHQQGQPTQKGSNDRTLSSYIADALASHNNSGRPSAHSQPAAAQPTNAAAAPSGSGDTALKELTRNEQTSHDSPDHAISLPSASAPQQVGTTHRGVLKRSAEAASAGLSSETVKFARMHQRQLQQQEEDTPASLPGRARPRKSAAPRRSGPAPMLGADIVLPCGVFVRQRGQLVQFGEPLLLFDIPAAGIQAGLPPRAPKRCRGGQTAPAALPAVFTGGSSEGEAQDSDKCAPCDVAPALDPQWERRERQALMAADPEWRRDKALTTCWRKVQKYRSLLIFYAPGEIRVRKHKATVRPGPGSTAEQAGRREDA